jgi:LysM repeat protein
VTREHKLALIVGFSLVLLVGVLIADHLSLARRVQISTVGDRELTLAQGPSILVADPLRGLETALPHQLLPIPEPRGEVLVDPLVAPSSLAATGGSTEAEVAPIEIMQGRPRQEMQLASISDSDLIEQVRRMGGSIRERGGHLEILPPAAELQRPTAERSGAAGAAMRTPTPANSTTPPAAAARSGSAAVQEKMYVVQGGDTYMKIAQRHYGTSQVWRELAKYNGADDGVVRLGSTIRIPSREMLTGRPAPTPATPNPAAQPAPAKPGRTELAAMTYTVKRGETLGEIAQKVLGTSRRWKELAEYNKLDDPDHVEAGTVLRVPPMRG